MDTFFGRVGDIALNLIIILTVIQVFKNQQEIHQLRQEIEEMRESNKAIDRTEHKHESL